MPRIKTSSWIQTTITKSSEGCISVMKKDFSQETEASIISCANCRKIHRTCDRALPSCSSCLKKGIPCNYQTPKKVGRKPRANTNPSSSEEAPSNFQQDSVHTFEIVQPLQTLAERIVEAYFEADLLGVNLISREEMTQFMYHTDYATRRDVLCLLLSIQAFYEQRLGFLDLALGNFHQVEDILQQASLEHSEGYVVACVHAYLAYFYFGYGDNEKVLHYNSKLKSYIDESQETHDRLKGLKWCRGSILHVTYPHFPNFSPDLAVEVFKLYTDGDLPREWLGHLQQATTIQNVEDQVKFLTSVICHVQKHHVNVPSHCPITEIMRDAMLKSMSISMLSNANAIVFKQEIFDRVVEMVKMTERKYFPFVPPAFALYYGLTLRMLLKYHTIVESGEVDTHEEDYYQLLRKMVVAASVLKKRYPIMEQYNDSINESIELMREKDRVVSPDATTNLQKSKLVRLLEFDLELRNFVKPFIESEHTEELLEIPNASSLLMDSQEPSLEVFGAEMVESDDFNIFESFPHDWH